MLHCEGLARELSVLLGGSSEAPRVMRSSEARKYTFSSGETAVAFLIWYGILAFPGVCASGHDSWKPNDHGMGCRKYMGYAPDEECEEEEEDGVAKKPKKKYCNSSSTWRAPRSFMHTLPCTLLPHKFMECLFWFIESEPDKRNRTEAEVSEDTRSDCQWCAEGHAVVSAKPRGCWPHGGARPHCVH